ncbi:MAG: hypothetical protein ACPGVP_18570 [Thiolinea sp.]
MLFQSSTTLASLLLFIMAMLHIGSTAWLQIPGWLSGLCGWLAFLLLLIFRPGQFKQFLALAGIGLLLLLWGWWLGSPASIEKILLQNNGLIVMLYCISFLKLLSAPMQASDKSLPTGRASALKTLLGVHLLGSVINASILVLVADRFNKANAINQLSTTLASRAFSTAALWSPFFGAMAVALTYSPEAELYSLMAIGIPLTLIAMLYTLFELGGNKLQKLRTFTGYPMQADSLWVPVLLASSVIIGHQLWPAVPILVMISAAAIILTTLFLLVKRSDEKTQKFREHTRNSAPLMSRELGLFLGAGILSVGAQSVFAGFSDFHPFTSISGVLLSALLAGGIIISLLGAHPVVSISVIGPFLLPLEGDPNMVAVLYLSMWSLGTIASPFSGMNAIIRNQFGVSGGDLFRWHIRYVLVMWLLVSVIFIVWASPELFS